MRRSLAIAILGLATAACWSGQSRSTAVTASPAASASAAVSPAGFTFVPGTLPPSAPTQPPTPSGDLVAQTRRLLGALGVAILESATPTVGAGSIATTVEFDVSSDSSSDMWTVEWDPAGTLRGVSHNPATRPASGRTLTAAGARTRSVNVAASLDAGLGAPQSVQLKGGEWLIAWGKTVDGIPTSASEADLRLRADGSFIEYRREWSTLAPRPAKLLTAQEARALVEACGTNPSPCTLRLLWYRPSTFWVSDPLILCWQISHQAGLVYVGYFDAGTGELVDVIEGGWA